MDSTSLNIFTWMNDLTFVILGWFLKSFIKRDSKSKEKCLHRLYELKRLLFKLNKSKDFSDQDRFSLLMEIKLVLENLDVECEGLVLHSYELRHLLSQSLHVFKKYDHNEELPHYDTEGCAEEIMHVWDSGTDGTHTFESLTRIRNFIRKWFPARIVVWFLDSLIFAFHKLKK